MSMSHSAQLHPKIESAVSPDENLVSITMHGIAACREITLQGNSSSPSQMSFSRVMNPTDLMDKTVILEMPVVSTFTIDDPCGSPATITMLAERLGAGSQHMTLRSNGVAEAITHCNLTLNNGTVTTQPAISQACRSYYKSAAEVNGNNGLGMREKSTSPFLANLSGVATHQNGVLDTTLPVHMHKRKVTAITFKDGGHVFQQKTEANHDAADVSTATLALNLIEYFNSGDASRGKQYAKGDANYWPDNLGENPSSDNIETIGHLTTGNAPYTWNDKVKIATITVKDTIFATVPHDLLDDENNDECLSNIRFFDLKIAMPDPSVMFNLSRDFSIPWEPFIDHTFLGADLAMPGRYAAMSTAVEQIEDAESATINEDPDASSPGSIDPLGRNVISPGVGKARPLAVTCGGYRVTMGALTPVLSGAPKDEAMPLSKATMPLPTIQPSAEFGRDNPVVDTIVTWDDYYAAQDPRCMISNVDYSFASGQEGQPKLHMRLYQSAVPVPRALSFGINTDIIRSGRCDIVSADGVVGGTPRGSLQTQSFSLSEVPQSIYVFAVVEPDASLSKAAKMSMPPQLANIEKITFRTTANTGTLSSATSRQLYQMCQRNGCNQDFTSFVNDGNVIKIKPSKDLGGWVEGARETFTHDFSIDIQAPCQDVVANARALDSANSQYHQISGFASAAMTQKDDHHGFFQPGQSSLSHTGLNINYQPPTRNNTKDKVFTTPIGNFDGAIRALKGTEQRALTDLTDGPTAMTQHIQDFALAPFVYDKMVTVPSAMKTFSSTMFNGKKVTVYTVYEMVGTCHLQADGLMQTTSGFDTSTIVNTLQGEGISHSADASVGVKGGSIAGMFKAGARALFGHAKEEGKRVAKEQLTRKFNEMTQ